MPRKWVAARKTINISQETADALAELVEKTGMTETDIFNVSVQSMHSNLDRAPECVFNSEKEQWKDLLDRLTAVSEKLTQQNESPSKECDRVQPQED